jgi:hypothetical protein
MMTMTEDALRLRADKVEWRVVEDEVVALTLDNDRYLGANRTGALLWQALAEGSDLPSLVGLLEHEGAAGDEAEQDARAFLDALRARDLLEE